MHPANLICLLVLQLLGLSPFSVSAAAASRSNHQSNQMIQYTSDALRDYDLADLALLVYKTQPDVVTEVLQNLVDGGDLKKSLADEIVRNLNSAKAAEARAVVPCQLCRNLVSSMKESTGSPANWTLLTERWISICESITIPRGIRGDILCSGTLNLQMPHVYNVLKSEANLEYTVCQFLNLCPLLPEILSDSMTPSEGTARKISSRTDSEIDSKSQRKTKQDGARTRQAPPENSTIVVQLTDIHVEPKYAVGSNTDCGLPVCCVPEYGAGFASKYGDYKCNIPRTTIELFVQKTLTFTPDVVLFSGDVPPHSVWEETPQSQKACSEILVDILTQSLPENKVYPNIGNHEGYPTNLFSVKMLNFTPDFLEWYADLWQPLADFTPQDKTNIRRGGFYTKLVSPGLRLISFNTNYMYTFNWYNVENHKPQATSEYTVMTNFVNTTLAQARSAGEKVILMGHHPPGGNDYLVKGSRWYRDLVLQYYDIIVLQPTGHTHYDEFRMIYDPEGVPRSVVLVAPSMSSGGTRNPSMRVFYMDKDTKELLDYDHYYLDIGPVLMQGDLPENWADLITLLYSAKDEYSMPDLSPASWHDLLNRFETDSVLLNTHRLHKYADADETPNICLDRCQHNYVCRMRHVNYDQYKNCTISLLDMVDWGSIFNPTTTEPTQPPTGSNNSAENLTSATYLTLSFTIFMLFTMVRGQRS